MRGVLRTAVTAAILVAIWAAASRLAQSPLFPGPLDVARSLGSGARGGYARACRRDQRACASLVGYAIALATGVPLGLAARAQRRARSARSVRCCSGSPAFRRSAGCRSRSCGSASPRPRSRWSSCSARRFPSRSRPRARCGSSRRPSSARRARWARAGRRCSSACSLPAAMPGIVTGAKMGWTFALRSLMAGELLFVSGGLGQLLETGRDLADTALVLGIVAVIVVLSRASERVLFGPLERVDRAPVGNGDAMSEHRDESELEDSGVRLAPRGRVFLVGAGPGDPELLTVRAHRLLSRAPRSSRTTSWSAPAILALAPPGAELVAGGAASRHVSGGARDSSAGPRACARRSRRRSPEGRRPDDLRPGRGRGRAAGGAPHSVRDRAGRQRRARRSGERGHPAHASRRGVERGVRHGAQASRRGDDDLASRVPREGTVVLYMGLSTLREHGARARRRGSLAVDARSPSSRTRRFRRSARSIADLATIADAVERRCAPGARARDRGRGRRAPDA